MRNKSFLKKITKIIAIFVIFAFTTQPVLAQFAMTDINLPTVGTMIGLSQGFNPAVIKGLKMFKDDPFRFDFLVDRGDSGLFEEGLKEESTKLIKYFLASLTVPEEDLWVNLSPHEKNRIIPDAFGVTEMGRDLLSQDYILKQITSSLMYPEDAKGKAFWNKIYEKAYKLYGTTDVDVETFNKVWIVPENALVYENGDRAFVVESKLKVMLEEDYFAMKEGAKLEQKEQVQKDIQVSNAEMSTQMIREMIIPEIEREVNEGENFANLRQIYNSMILAAWFKRTLKESILGKIYMDQNKTVGVDVEDKQIKEKIYNQYLQAFEQGVYNYIREEYDPKTQEIVPKRYFSGGFARPNFDEALMTTKDASFSEVVDYSGMMVMKTNLAVGSPPKDNTVLAGAPDTDEAMVVDGEVNGEVEVGVNRKTPSRRVSSRNKSAKEIKGKSTGEMVTNSAKSQAKSSQSNFRSLISITAGLNNSSFTDSDFRDALNSLQSVVDLASNEVVNLSQAINPSNTYSDNIISVNSQVNSFNEAISGARKLSFQSGENRTNSLRKAVQEGVNLASSLRTKFDKTEVSETLDATISKYSIEAVVTSLNTFAIEFNAENLLVANNILETVEITAVGLGAMEEGLSALGQEKINAIFNVAVDNDFNSLSSMILDLDQKSPLRLDATKKLKAKAKAKDNKEQASKKESDSVTAKVEDKAMVADKNVGGIDLNPEMLDLRTRGDSFEFDLPTNIEELEKMNIPGLTPVIFDIVPASSLQIFLGINSTEDIQRDQDLASAKEDLTSQ
ncbi:MAG: hypothetical protein P9X22_08100 [Candidatus Zapsychrus exili]|nr:hypothetical protein [Candidatus Zapsychrus exili]